MKNTIRLIGIIAFIVIIGFSLITCDDGSGDDNGGGGGNSGATLGQETLSITDQQVYTMVENETNYSISYTNYTGSMTLNENGYTSPLGTAKITNGKLNYTQTGAPNGDALVDILDLLEWGFLNATASSNDVKCAIISGFYSSSTDYSLFRGNQSVSNINVSEQTGTMTYEEVSYIYVDKNVTITAAKVGPTPEDGVEYTYNAVNLSLTKGWNAVTSKIVSTATKSKTSVTYSVTKGDTGRWILTEH
jgi:hypothetical protein